MGHSVFAKHLSEKYPKDDVTLKHSSRVLSSLSPSLLFFQLALILCLFYLHLPHYTCLLSPSLSQSILITFLFIKSFPFWYFIQRTLWTLNLHSVCRVSLLHDYDPLSVIREASSGLQFCCTKYTDICRQPFT